MRLEYVVVGFVLMLVILLVVISLLSGVIPGMNFIFTKVK